jgi:hypothetical protein
MPHTISPPAFPSSPSGTVSNSNAIAMSKGLITLNELSPQDQKQLEDVLKFKLRGVPTNHLPDLRLSDILQQTPRTRFTHIPQDIDLAWFLRNRSRVDEFIHAGMQNKGGGEAAEDVDEKVFRAAWYYRLSAVHQFQRYHDAARWNLTIYTALLTRHALSKSQESKSESRNIAENRAKTKKPMLSPTALRFMHSYLSAVLEQHTAPTQFDKRDEFIALWRNSRFDLFAIHKSWAKKALQRASKALSSEWSVVLSHAQREVGSEYENGVGRFVGCLVPGGAVGDRADRALTSQGLASDQIAGGEVRCYSRLEELDTDVHGRGEANELLDALRAPFPSSVTGQRAREPTDDGLAMVCDPRTAITCVQITRPRDMLPVLMRLFPVSKNKA